jgi:fluoroacetyl-CoA thioesterase
MNSDEEPSGKSSPQKSDPALAPASNPSRSPSIVNAPALVPGLEGRFEADVRPEWTRAHFQAHLPAVFSTPAMIGMMEAACAQAIADALPPGTLSVGTRIEVDHLKALPVGAHVVATARLAEVHGRFLVFEVEARSGESVIGRGRISHAIVDLARFARIAGERSGPG